MRRWLVVMLAATAPAQSIEVAFEPAAAVRTFGERFAVVVTRRWPAGAEVEAFDPAVLAPLALGEAQVELLPDGERRRYAVRALQVGEVAFGTVAMRWRRGGAVQTTTAAVPGFAVASVLPSPAGAVEWPEHLLLPAARGQGWIVPLCAALLAAVSTWWWRRRRGAPAPTPVGDGWDAVRELTALATDPGDDVAAFCAAVKRVLREHLVRRFGLPAPVRTSEELLSAVPAAPEALRAALREVDLVLFAAADGGASREHVRDRALAFVRATS